MNSLVSFRLCTLSDEALVEKIDRATDDMYKKGKIPMRHIPARPNEDYDILVGELLVRFWGIVKKANLNLCDTCVHHIAECTGNPKFGNGRGNDNVYECDGYEKETEFGIENNNYTTTGSNIVPTYWEKRDNGEVVRKTDNDCLGSCEDCQCEK